MFAWLLGIAGLLYAIHEHKKTKDLKRRVAESEKLHAERLELYARLDACDELWSPKAQEALQKLIANFQRVRNIMPEIYSQVDTEKAIVNLVRCLR